MISTSGQSKWEAPARLLVGIVRRAHRYRVAASLLGLLAILGSASGYLLIGTLGIDPLNHPYRVRVELDRSGGLLPGQEVTLRGVRVGRLDAVDVAGDKVIAVAAIDEHVRIPASGQVRAAAQYAAGGQYNDLLNARKYGPNQLFGAITLYYKHMTIP
ncbi:MlaD family protein, partial [Nocardia abscessus]|uniref:MlaD family protein n=1 Tax=Nocardia abscessus TaxID=120957 RepID=UPI0024547FC1